MKANRYILSLAAALAAVCASAQSSVESIVEQVVTRSFNVAAAQSQRDAELAESEVQRALPDPEVEFNYLWGQTSEVGNRTDLRITQSFDFATLSGKKAALAGSMKELAELRYDARIVELVRETRSLCADLAYYNAVIASLEEYLLDIQTLNRAQAKRAEMGEGTVFDSGKAKIQLASVKTAIAGAKVERIGLLTALRQLAGDPELEFTDCNYQTEEILGDFNAWCQEVIAENPTVRGYDLEVKAAGEQLAIEKSAWVPNLNLGYMSEIGLTDKYRGLTVGVSVPLWSNANKVKSAARQQNLANARQQQAKLAVRSQLAALWEETEAYREAATESRELLAAADNRALMLKAVIAGEISMLDYIVDLESYYDLLQQTLDIERSYNQASIKLLYPVIEES